MMASAFGFNRSDFKALAYLRQGELELRAGAWRFGTLRIGAGVVDRLVASGQAVRHGDQVRLAPQSGGR